MVSVTICSPSSAIGEQWRDLVRRAPSNVFMDPAALTAASVTDFAKIYLLLAWDESQTPGKLVGRWAEAPVGMIGPLIDEPVGCLIGAKLVVIDFLVVVGGEQGIGTGGGFGVAAVKKARAVVRPRRAGEFDPLQVVGAVLPARHIAHMEFLPVRAAPRRAVDEQRTVIREGERRQRHGAVGRQRVWIEQRLRLCRQRALHVEHRLILQP